ncbi:NAD(P)H-dependent oxidoreductase [Marinobacteraceae bacterium S3BR75-40.1]
MTTLLQINSSLFANDGQSTRLSDHYVDHWRQVNPEGHVRVRDLAAEPVPHLDGERFQALVTPVEERTEAQRAVVAFSDALINEWREADEVVIGLPLYNLGLPSTLKAYFDHIARSGETFRYTANGPEGLLKDRPVRVLAARGGQYRGTPLDTQTGHVSHFLGLLGIRDVQFVYAEGLAIGEDHKAEALQKAQQAIRQLVA